MKSNRFVEKENQRRQKLQQKKLKCIFAELYNVVANFRNNDCEYVKCLKDFMNIINDNKSRDIAMILFHSIFINSVVLKKIELDPSKVFEFGTKNDGEENL